MLMQALRKGFLSVKKKRDLAGRGLPPVAWSFFSFSLCFLFNSSSFMMTGLAASALVAILTPPPETISKGESTHRIIPNVRCQRTPPLLPITLLGSRPAYPECAPLPPSPPSSPHPQPQTSPRDSGPVTEKAPSAGGITAEGLEEQLALLWFKFRAWSTSRAMLGNGKTGGSAGVRGRSLVRREQNNPSKLSAVGLKAE